MRACLEELLTTRQVGSLETFVRHRWRCGLCALGLTVCVIRAEPQFATDAMSDNELRAFRNQLRSELQRLLEAAPTEETPEGKAYRGSTTVRSTTRPANRALPPNEALTIPGSQRLG
jgi:hypothetical protein